jgi:methionyl-tRNA synthetase
LVLARNKKFRAPAKTKIDKEIISRARKTFESADKNITSCQFRFYLQEIISLAEYGNKYFDDKKVWAIENKKEFDSVIANLLYLISALGVLFEPIMPDASERLRKDLGLSRIEHIENFKQLNDYLLKNLSKIEFKETKPLFKKISKEQINSEIHGSAI